MPKTPDPFVETIRNDPDTKNEPRTRDPDTGKLEPRTETITDRVIRRHKERRRKGGERTPGGS